MICELGAKSGKRSGFNEKKLAKIRREKGFKSFFESNADFRDTIKQGKLRIIKNSFYRQIGEEKYKQVFLKDYR
jgi:hypothetical protein